MVLPLPGSCSGLRRASDVGLRRRPIRPHQNRRPDQVRWWFAFEPCLSAHGPRAVSGKAAAPRRIRSCSGSMVSCLLKQYVGANARAHSVTTHSLILNPMPSSSRLCGPPLRQPSARRSPRDPPVMAGKNPARRRRDVGRLRCGSAGMGSMGPRHQRPATTQTICPRTGCRT